MLIRKLTAVNASIVANKIVDKGFYRKLKTKQNKPIAELHPRDISYPSGSPLAFVHGRNVETLKIGLSARDRRFY